MAISKDKQDALKKRMEDLSIREEDLIEKFIAGSGKGGQKINKTSSCVYIKHIPSGTTIKCQEDRSRELNRFLARRALCDAIEGVTEVKLLKINKIIKQKKSRERKSKKKHQIE
jgi:peptide chain release factor